jgi:hypothetical protein
VSLNRRLRDRVTLKRRTSTNSGGVRKVTSLDTLAPARIPCQHASPSQAESERLFGQQIRQFEAHVFTLRDFPDASMADVAIWHEAPGTDRELEIVGRHWIGRDRAWVVLACREVRA